MTGEEQPQGTDTGEVESGSVCGAETTSQGQMAVTPNSQRRPPGTGLNSKSRPFATTPAFAQPRAAKALKPVPHRADLGCEHALQACSESRNNFTWSRRCCKRQWPARVQQPHTSASQQWAARGTGSSPLCSLWRHRKRLPRGPRSRVEAHCCPRPPRAASAPLTAPPPPPAPTHLIL